MRDLILSVMAELATAIRARTVGQPARCEGSGWALGHRSGADGHVGIGKVASIAAVALAAMMPAFPAFAGPPRLLVLGDSLTAGYGLPLDQGFQVQLQRALAAAGHPVAIVDGAVSGDTSAGGLARLDWVLGQGADVAIVELGANDGLRGLDPKEMEANLTAILNDLASRHIPVLLTGIYVPPNYGPAYQAQFRAVFDRLGARPGVIYDPFFLQGVAMHPELIQRDGLHPNAAGVKREVARLLPLVEQLLARIPDKKG